MLLSASTRIASNHDGILAEIRFLQLTRIASHASHPRTSTFHSFYRCSPRRGSSHSLTFLSLPPALPNHDAHRIIRPLDNLARYRVSITWRLTITERLYSGDYLLPHVGARIHRVPHPRPTEVQNALVG